MKNNSNDDFKITNSEFTIFVVGQTYYLNRGNEYLSHFRNKDNWIASDKILVKRIKRLLSWIQKNTPNISELMETVIDGINSSNKKTAVIDIILALIKLACLTEHVAVSPKDLNPIIIEEQFVTTRNLTQYISMYEKSHHRPTIIILLKDDNYEQAKKLLSSCPSGINVKMIENSGYSTCYKVINNGADSVEEFIDFYSRQCFSACCNTKHRIITAAEWSQNEIINKFSPTIFQIRSTFIKEHKLDAKENIKWLGNQLPLYKPNSSCEELIKKSFICLNDLFQVYCLDKGGEKLTEAWELSKELDNEILKAHVYRYSHFFDCGREDKQDYLKFAEDIFLKYGITDHELYCRNNRLIHQFSMDKITTSDFFELKQKSLSDTPGLVLMAHIINNVGVAYLFDHLLDRAVEEFDEGLKYAKYNHIQRLALKSNRMIAKTLSHGAFDETEARNILGEIFNTPSLGIKKMPFLTAQFALNVIASALIIHPNLALQLLTDFRIIDLIQSAFDTNIMGTGSMLKQMEILSVKYSRFKILDKLRIPRNRTQVDGIRQDFICQYGLNPFFFNTWL